MEMNRTEIPKISIIVPVYNVESYLPRCIDSILAQTYTDFELILVDDGSPDNSGAICDEYAAKDSRIRVIHKENGGVSSARNTGLDFASGKYISFVDSDDVVHPQMYEILLSVLQNTQSGFSACSVQKIPENYNFSVFDTHLTPNSHEFYSSKEVINQYIYRFYGKLTAYIYNKLYRKELFDHLRFDTKYSIYEDEMVALELIESAQSIVYVPLNLYYYRQTSGSLMRKSFDSRLLLTFTSLQHMIDFMNERGIQNEVALLEHKWFLAFMSIYYVLMYQYPSSLHLISVHKTSFRQKIHCFLNNPYLPRMYKLVLLLFLIHPKLAHPLYSYLQQ